MTSVAVASQITTTIEEAKTILREMISVLGYSYSAGLFFWGPPGIGKSALVRQVGEELNLPVVDIRLSLLDPVDLRGLPVINPEKKQAQWLPPAFLPKKGSSSGILFLDEINVAPPTIQASAYQLILDRRVGEYELPEGWVVVAAGNRETDRAVVYKMPSPLANRFIHLEIRPDLDTWKQWAFKENISPTVIGFLNFRPDLLFAFDPKKNPRSYPTPRSWEFVSQALQVLKSNPAPVITGAVGDAAGTEFLAFMEMSEKVPDAENILEGRSSAVPKQHSILYALVGALVARLKLNSTEKRIGNLIRYSLKIHAEFSVLLIKDALTVCPEIASHSDFSRWTAKHKSVLL
ncbi:MAG: ATP-binding protein [Candidatus Hodarchaeota archaeon]